MAARWIGAIAWVVAAIVLVACSGSEAGSSGSGATADLEMESSWLRAAAPMTTVIEPPGSRVEISHTVLLRDETLASSNDWVLLDAKQESVRIPRSDFIKYLTPGGVRNDAPTEPRDLAKSVLLVGSGNTVLFADLGESVAGRIELKPRAKGSTPAEDRRKSVDDLVASAALLPGAQVTRTWSPERPKALGACATDLTTSGQGRASVNRSDWHGPDLRTVRPRPVASFSAVAEGLAS